jgi:hypothetical protein
MNATRERFKSWDNTLARVEELEAGAGDSTQLKAQISTLTTELAARNIEIKTLRAAAAGQRTTSTINQPPAAKPIEQMTSRELVDACDTATQAGDKALANRYYEAHSARKASR